MEVNLWFPPVKSCSYTSYKYENCNFTDICASIDMTTNEQFYFTSMDNENISTILDEVKGIYGRFSLIGWSITRCNIIYRSFWTVERIDCK